MIEFSANMENTFTAIIVLIIQILQKQKAQYMYMVRRHLFNLNVVNIVYFAVMHTIIIHLQNVSLFLSHLYNVDSLQGLNR